MKKALHILPLFLLLTFMLSAQSVMDLAKKASEETNSGKYQNAIETYNQIISAEPEVNQWYFYRGQDFNMLNENKKALSDYNKAIELAPQYFDAYLSRAILYFSLNEPEKSINDYNQTLRYLKDESVKAFIYNNRGNAKALRKDLQGAYNDFQKAYTIDNHSIAALDNLGKILNKLERGDEALFYFKKMLELDSTNISAQSDLAYTLLNLHRFQESIEQYNSVLIKNPNSPLALSNRGLAKMNLSDYKGALDDANHSLELYPQNPYTYRNRGMIKIAMNKKTEGCADFKEALNLGFTQKYDTEVEEFYKHYCSATKF